jgi:serine/threonine protein kinase
MNDKVKFPRSSMLSKEARHLMKCMLDKDYITRYGIEEIRLHPWISEEFIWEDDYQEGIKFFEPIYDNDNDFFDEIALDVKPNNRILNRKTSVIPVGTYRFLTKKK